MKKRWFVIPVVAGMLALVVTGGAIFAHGNGPGGKGNQVTTRVAEILGLEPSVVQDAFQQAVGEQHEARLQGMLDRLVTNETITQEEADAILTWYQARPEAALHLRGVIFHNEESVQRILNHLVETEHITQAEADEVLAWYQAKPDVLPEGFGSPRRGFGEQFRGHSREHFKGQMFQRGTKFGNSGETDSGISQQSLRSLAPQISTEGILQ